MTPIRRSDIGRERVRSRDRISLYRLVIFNRVLSNRRTPISLQDLAHEWEDRSGENPISTETIEKDLRRLRELGAPIKYDDEMAGYRYTNREFYFPSVDFIGKLVGIDERIRRGDYPNQQTLAREFKTTERIIERNIEFLRDWARLPIEYDEHRKGY